MGRELMVDKVIEKTTHEGGSHSTEYKYKLTPVNGDESSYKEGNAGHIKTKGEKLWESGDIINPTTAERRWCVMSWETVQGLRRREDRNRPRYPRDQKRANRRRAEGEA